MLATSIAIVAALLGRPALVVEASTRVPARSRVVVSAPSSGGRRVALELAASVCASAGAGAITTWLQGPTGGLGVRVEEVAGPRLRSVNELVDLQRSRDLSHRAAPRSVSRAEARTAALALVDTARQMEQLIELAQRRDWAAIATMAEQIRADVEGASRTLMACTELSDDLRREIGWQWGHCGWRSCGAQADVVQLLCKLQEGLGLFVPAEAALYIDAATRGVDELVGIAHTGGLLTEPEVAWLERRVYLDKASLDAVLGEDGFNGEEWEL